MKVQSMFTMMDVQTYQNKFAQLRPSLTSYVYRLLTNHQHTENILQETHQQATNTLANFQADTSFEAWVFAIATGLVKKQLKAVPRGQNSSPDLFLDFEEMYKTIDKNPAQGDFVLSEYIDYCFTAVSNTLLLEEQVCLLLKEVYNFSVSEIGFIAELSIGQVKYGLANAQARLLDIFNKRCSLISPQGSCNQCAELNAMAYPKQDFIALTETIPMIRQKNEVTPAQLLHLRLELVKGVHPTKAQGFAWYNSVLENK